MTLIGDEEEDKKDGEDVEEQEFSLRNSTWLTSSRVLFPLRNLLAHPPKLTYLQGSTQTTPCRHKMAYTHCRHPNPPLPHGQLSIITRPLLVERFFLGDAIPELMVHVGSHLNYLQPNMTEKGTHELSKLNTAITSRGFPAYHDSKETKLLRDALIIEVH